MADTDLIERLTGWFTDWNGERMVPGEPPRDGIHCDILMEAAAALAEKDARIAGVEAGLAVQRESKEYAQRCCIAAETALTASRAECEGLRAADYFGELVARARLSATKASAKFPQPNYVTLKIAEEAGEVVRGAVHYAENRMEWDEVEGEIVQLLAMLIRFVTEGDQINGITPPARAALSQKDTGNAA